MSRDEAAEDRVGPSYRILVRNLIVSCRIGVRERERHTSQRIRINLWIEARRPPNSGDDIATVVDYSDVAGRIRALAGAGHLGLIETLAERILDLLWADSRVQAATVRVEKLDVYDDAESVGVEMSRQRLGA